MNYRPTWNLESIPEDVFMRDYARRIGSRRAKKETNNPDERKRLDEAAEYMRTYRKNKLVR